MAKLSGGVAGERARAEDREREANKYLIDARRKAAAADLAEERNKDTLARALRKSEQDDRLKADALLGSAATTEIESQQKIGALEETRRERDQRAKEAAERMALDRERFKSDEAYRAGERAFKEKMVRLEASLRPKEFYNQLLGMATNPQDPNYEFAKNLLEARGGRSGAGADGRITLDQLTDNAMKVFQNTDVNKRIKDAAKRGIKLTPDDVYDEIFDRELQRAKNIYGENALKGMGKSSKSSSAGAVDTSNPLLSGKP
jgi:hypothetical protein